MKQQVNRRDFMKVAGVTAGVAVATGFNPLSYAQNEKIRVACIGTGGQGGFHIRWGLTQCEDIEIIAICDWYTPFQAAAWEAAGGKDREIKRYYDYRKMLEEMPDIDAVVIATPLWQHYQVAMDCLDAGKHVFLEKTMCKTVEQCRDVVKKVHETGKVFQVGQQRRYNPEYNKALWLARGDGAVGRPSETGRVNHINTYWHRNNDWRRPVDKTYVLNDEEKQFIKVDLERHLNWRLYDEYSTGMFTELAAHQLDVTNWFLGTMPKKIYASGGIDYWRDTRECSDNICIVAEYEVGRSDAGFAMIPPRNEYQKPAQINRPYTVRMTWSSICANAKQGYGEYILGDRGGFLLTEQSGCTYYPEAAAKEDWNKVAAAGGNAAATGKDIVSGGTREKSATAYTEGMKLKVVDERGVPYAAPTDVDRMQFARFAKDIRENGTPKANEMVGLYTAIACLAADESMRTGNAVTIDPASYAFDFETPDPFQYEYFEEPKAEA